MDLRVLQGQLAAAQKDQAAALQASLNQQSIHNSTMSNAIEDIRAEHEENLKDLEAQIKVRNTSNTPFQKLKF